MDYICLVTAELMIIAADAAAVFGCCFSIMEETEEIEEVEVVLLLLEVKVQRGATTCDDDY